MLLVYLCVLHFVADFLLQSREMGKKKSTEVKWLAKHLAIQTGIVFIGLTPVVGPFLSLQFSVANAVIHGIIDWNIWRFYKLSVIKRGGSYDWKFWDDHWFYTTIGCDQLLHTATLILLAQWLFV